MKSIYDKVIEYVDMIIKSHDNNIIIVLKTVNLHTYKLYLLIFF